MTYAGFKSYLYAGLSKNDPRVAAARGWIESHYTLTENPGVGTDGLYYYYVMFAKALDADGRATVLTPDGSRDWRVDLVNQLSSLQNEDGSFRSVDDRWMENDPVLITAYALNALQLASKSLGE
jgi:squalene-hopene/tetraprenyl-beta-curcumene cyclase